MSLPNDSATCPAVLRQLSGSTAGQVALSSGNDRKVALEWHKSDARVTQEWHKARVTQDWHKGAVGHVIYDQYLKQIFYEYHPLTLTSAT